MDWIKIKVQHVLNSGLTDKEIGRLVKYQALIAMKERVPIMDEIKTIMRPSSFKDMTEKLTLLNENIHLIEQKVLKDVQEIKEKRQKNKEKQRKFRDNLSVNNENITGYVTDTNDGYVPVTRARVLREEEIREEYKEKKDIKKEKTKPPPKFIKPSLSQIKDYLQKYIAEKQLEIPVAVEAEKFESHYEASGWKVGNKPMVCWKAALRGWVLRNNNFNDNNGKKEKKYKSIREVFDEI